MIPVSDALDEAALRRLLDAGRDLVGDLDPEVVLQRLLRAATEITGARYAALGILDRHRDGLERFLAHGVDDAVRREIGPPPRGRGLLGALIGDPRPLRLEFLADDPRASGFPPGHPRMTTFLGVPILIRGEAWGNLYLADKEGGEPFTQADEDAATTLASWASVAIANARSYQDAERRRAVLEATTAIALAAGAETDAGEVLELIVERARELVGARGVAILVRDEDGLAVAAEAGELPPATRGALGLAASEGLLVPLVFRGRSLGMLAAFGPRGGGEEERLLRSFAASAATAVATARSAEARRLRGAIQAAEAERTRWARELHDDTLQGLGALRLLLVAGRRAGDAARLGSAVDAAIERLEEEIDSLRGLVRELRPAALDELGLGPAIEGLAERAARREEIDVETTVELHRRLSAEVETAVYRIVQEALTNAVRHAGASVVHIYVREAGHTVQAEVADDGRGFDADAQASGFGLAGIRERVALLGGELELESSGVGTRVVAALPL